MRPMPPGGAERSPLLKALSPDPPHQPPPQCLYSSRVAQGLRPQASLLALCLFLPTGKMQKGWEAGAALYVPVLAYLPTPLLGARELHRQGQCPVRAVSPGGTADAQPILLRAGMQSLQRERPAPRPTAWPAYVLTTIKAHGGRVCHSQEGLGPEPTCTLPDLVSGRTPSSPGLCFLSWEMGCHNLYLQGLP